MSLLYIKSNLCISTVVTSDTNLIRKILKFKLRLTEDNTIYCPPTHHLWDFNKIIVKYYNVLVH